MVDLDQDQYFIITTILAIFVPQILQLLFIVSRLGGEGADSLVFALAFLFGLFSCSLSLFGDAALFLFLLGGSSSDGTNCTSSAGGSLTHFV